MESEIEEAQRQIRMSAALIQDAFEGLTTLQRMHNRIPEPLPTRAPTDNSSIVSPSTYYTGPAGTRNMQDGVGTSAMHTSSMDPGHDVIVISAENSTLPSSSTSTSAPLPSQPQPRTLASSAAPPSLRGPRASDPALAALGSELRTMTQSFRERVSEFDELRRAIAQYTRERRSRATMTDRARSRSPPPNAPPSVSAVPSLPMLDTEDSSSSPSVPPSDGDAASGTSAPRRFDGRIRPMRGDRVMADRRSSLHGQRTGSESETSLGLLVAARTAASSSSNASSSVADTPTVNPASIYAISRSIVDPRPRPVALPLPDIASGVPEDRISTRNIPPNITSRITRLAQEIRQEGARITQQAESLRTWIYDRNARLDALRPLLSDYTTRSPGPHLARPGVSSDPHPTTVSGAVYASPTTMNTTPLPRLTSSGLLDPPLAQPPQRLGSSERDSRPSAVEQLLDWTHPPGPRRTADVAVRARYLRQSVPTTWSATSPSAPSVRGEERGVAWGSPTRARERTTDGPLSPPSRTIAPPGNHGVLRDAATSTSTSAGGALDGSAANDGVSAVRAAIERARNRRQAMAMESSADDDEDFAEARSYRVRRRYNADGDEEVVRVSLRPEVSSAGVGETSMAGLRTEIFGLDEDSEEEDSWMEAMARLDSMSRRSAARDTREEWQMPPMMVRSGTQMGTVVPSTTSGFAGYAAGVAGRRGTRGWPRLYAEEDGTSAESDSQYERDLAAMRARAQALVSANAPPRTLGGTTLPPPPPTTRPLGLMPTTQAPGSLWTDSSVRVRLRAGTSARVSEAADRRGGASPGHTPVGRSGRERAETERPMWGSPTPFYPSALPLPLVEDVGSLQARSRVFSSGKKIGRMARRRAVAQVGR